LQASQAAESARENTFAHGGYAIVIAGSDFCRALLLKADLLS
jgi:hypothetical protein